MPNRSVVAPASHDTERRWPIVSTMEMFKVFGYSQDWISSSTSSASDDDSQEDFFDWGNEENEQQQPKENQITSPLKRKHHTSQRHITGKRRARANTIRSNFDNSPDTLHCNDKNEVDCCGLIGEDPLPIISFRQGHMWPFAEHEQRMDPVLVAVEATAVCAMDVAMRRSATSEDDIPFPFALGSNFVGIVHRCSPQAEQLGITPGTRVAAIVKWGATSKYVSSPVENLVVVPKTLDAADMACLLSTYLPAFQALHHGRARPYRYTDTCLKGRRVLLTGGATLEVQALVRLARLAGATEIYVVAPKEHFSVLNKLQVTVLGEHPDEWLNISNRMHVVIDFAFPRNFSAVCDSLARRGRLVCSSPITNSTEKNWMSELDSIYEYSVLSMMKRATIFDMVENVQTSDGEVVKDLRFLLKMLSTRRIRPHIDRFIKVKDVGTAHEEMQRTALTGAIVCEPWNE